MAVASSTIATVAKAPVSRLDPRIQLQPKPQICFRSYFQFQLSNTLNLYSHSSIFRSLTRRNIQGFVFSTHAAVTGHAQGTFDPELRSVLELASESELYELERILFGPSYFSPLLKSITKRGPVDYYMIEEDPEERDKFIGILESRFLFLAADARYTLRGQRPSYRNTLLGVREKLSIHCSRNLSIEDLEAEIFLHLLQEYSSHESGIFPTSWKNTKISSDRNSLEFGLSRLKVQAVGALKIGTMEIHELFLKGGWMLTLVNLYRLLARKLSGSMFLEAVNYQIIKEIMKKGGHLAAANLESRVALLAAKQGVAGAAARYLGFRSAMALVGPMLWGTFLADVVIQMLGTDYARILRAIYAIAQIRIIRTYR